MASRTAIRAPTRAEWARRVEAHSLAVPAPLLREARANTQRCRNDVAFLASLAREISLSRARELTLAYRSVVGVMPGFRRKRSKQGARTSSELCVVFIVRRKREVDPASAQYLPRWLITFAERDGLRQPFALPTDVQDAAEHHGATAHTDSAVWAQRDGWPSANGSFAALVTLRHAAGAQTCVLSAQHVLTPFPDGGALQIRAGLPVSPLDASGSQVDAPRLGTSLPIGGLLRDDERPDRPSFDVQLAALDPAGDTLLRQRTPLRGLNAAQPWVRRFEDLMLLDRDGWFHLLTPDNHATSPGRGAIRMTLAHMPPTPVGLDYDMGGGPVAQIRQVYHAELLGFTAVDSGKPIKGDSGSPIVVRRDDGTMTLVAMHIGGGNGMSWAIPAWRLFDVSNWAQYPEGASVEPIEP